MIFSNIETSTMNISGAQHEMRIAYYGGAPGMLTSALAWLCAGIVALLVSPQKSVWVLFIGGMLIHPLSVLFCKGIGRPGKHAKGNPMGALAMASTFWLIFSLPLAYAASLMHIEWFFPSMLMVIGGRYLVFATMYGARIYWLCGLALALASYALAAAHASPGFAALIGSAIEAVFSILIFRTTSGEIRAAVKHGTQAA